MYIYAAMSGECQHLFWEDLTEGDDNSDIERAEVRDVRAERGELFAKGMGLKYGHGVLEGELFDWGHRDLSPTSGWSVRLGEDCTDRDAWRVDESLQRRHGEIGRTEE
jgi:hypothetical protein